MKNLVLGRPTWMPTWVGEWRAVGIASEDCGFWQALECGRTQ